MLIGLTGEYCAGKNHVAALLEKRGFQVLDVDKLGHRAIEAERGAIVARFGAGVLKPDGSVDRKALGELAFSRPEALAALEEIVHPAANRLSEEWIAERPGADLVLNAALLHRSSALERCSLVLLVKAPFPVRLFRALRRDRLPLRELLRRFRSQRRFEAQYYRNSADIHIVRNSGSFGPCARHRARALERRIDTLLASIGMVR